MSRKGSEMLKYLPGNSHMMSVDAPPVQQDRKLKYWNSLTMVCSDEHNPDAAAEKLDKLAIAQAKLAKSFGADEAKAFGTYFGGVAKASIQPGKVFPLVGEAQKQTMGADLKARQRLKTAGATLETVSKTCAALPKRDVCQF